MKTSICIPNYNYEKFIGRTISSVLAQTVNDWELVIADNASTDSSIEVIRSFEDPRITHKVNHCNVGFAGNLDQVGRMAAGELMIMLSSDDLMRPDALKDYLHLYEILGEDAVGNTVVCSSMDKINAEDELIGEVRARNILWYETDIDAELSDKFGCKVYRVDADVLLTRCLQTMQNPFNFAATCYPTKLYSRLEGYGGGRLINPDKWFHWRLLEVAKSAVFIDKPLFAYRWHDSNQTAQQAETGALKYQLDDYRATLEIDNTMLSRANLTQEEIIDAFIEYDIGRSGLATLAQGQPTRAKRILRFGESVYPDATKRNKKAMMLKTLLSLGLAGKAAASLAYEWMPNSQRTNPQ